MGHNTLELDQDDRLIAEYPINSKRVIGQSHYRLAKIYYDKADLLKAEGYFLKASKQCELPRDGFPLFKIYGFLIRVYSEGLNQEEAITYIEKSEELLENLALNLGTLTAEYFYNMGVVKTYRSDFAEAKTNFMLAHKKAQEENGGKPLTQEEKDKITINKTTEIAEKDAKPTQDAAKAAIEKSNQAIGKPDLSEPEKFVKTHTTPDAGNKFYIYQQREKSGNYIAIAYRNQNKTGYVTNREGGNVNQGVNAVIEHLNQREDNVPDND
jgi:tetratricopeptide (TPR) repeat protein